jgi:hypothetical protein
MVVAYIPRRNFLIKCCFSRCHRLLRSIKLGSVKPFSDLLAFMDGRVAFRLVFGLIGSGLDLRSLQLNVRLAG